MLTGQITENNYPTQHVLDYSMLSGVIIFCNLACVQLILILNNVRTLLQAK